MENASLPVKLRPHLDTTLAENGLLVIRAPRELSALILENAGVVVVVARFAYAQKIQLNFRRKPIIFAPRRDINMMAEVCFR